MMIQGARTGGTMKTLAAHLATAIITVSLVLMWMGDRGREAPPGGNVGDLRTTDYAMPSVPPPLPDTGQDPDEQINIRVYQADNRGVVNITNVSGGSPYNDEESSTGGTGSGFLIDSAGHILTNYHVVSGAESLEVTLFDGSTHPAKVIGVDPSNDVAVVRIAVPKDKLAPLALGDSAHLLVGQKVLALGNPFGLQRTLTTGIISSLDRSIRAKNGRTIKGIVQTDAAINPGNSGGPLLNSRGEVIGITTAILSPVGQSAGIGFAVPINTIKRILKPLIERGRVVRADLGLKQVYPTDQGLYIVDLVEGGPADRAGLKPLEIVIERFGRYTRRRPDPDSADRIVAIDGKPVRTVEDLLNEIEAHSPGEVVKVRVVREGKARDVDVTLGQGG
ncbi:MAG: trypsin-like serine protease with C-terminal domain [Planctomycetota bacterium]|nr:trypsin-like serine protease with C-terminal domain [Planctomycetota bacterium]